MYNIDLTVMPERLERVVQRAQERNIIIPTFAEMKEPNLIPSKIKEELTTIGLWITILQQHRAPLLPQIIIPHSSDRFVLANGVILIRTLDERSPTDSSFGGWGNTSRSTLLW